MPVTLPCTLSVPKPLSPTPNSLLPPFESQTLAATTATTEIGEVIDGPDDGVKRPVHDGVQYDYVFDVDIGDGEPIRKLPYNRSDNVYDTADKWLLKENLPLSYRQQVVEFILQNSGQKDFILDSSFRDPYTGSNAYVPGQSSMPGMC
ncbi:phospholipase A2-activating protein [Tanacetum coccineum]